MRSTCLTLICHASTDAQRIGRFHLLDDPAGLPLASQQGFDPAAQNLIAPELRTRQTAEALGLAGQPDNDLRDCDLGHWQGLSLKQLQQQDPLGLQQWLSDPHARPHGGESVAQLYQRVADWMERRTDPGHWQVITHPLVIRVALLHVLRSPLSAFHLIDVLPLSRVSLSRYDRWRLRIE